MSTIFTQAHQITEHAGTDNALASTKTAMAEELFKAADNFFEDDVLPSCYEIMNETYAGRVKQTRDILCGCRAKAESMSKDVITILDLCVRNCETVLKLIRARKLADGIDETIQRTDLLLRGTANALKKGNLNEYIRTISGQVPYIYLANDAIGEADSFAQAIRMQRSDGVWITSFTGSVLCNNDMYVDNCLLQNLDPDEEKKNEMPLVNGLLTLTWMIKTILNDDMDVYDHEREEALDLITDALIAQVKAVKAADNPDASLNTPVEGILPLTFYSFDYIDAQCRKAAAA